MITELELTNWCQHRQRRLEFGPGITALIGPNGSGKSNIQSAVKWLWTGINPNFGTKADNICQLAQPQERANARMVMTKRGHTYELYRALRPETDQATLKFDGNIVAAGETKVTNKLSELYGLDPKLVDRFMLVAQDDIFGFLAEQPDVRLKLFQQLFDTTHAARCIKAVADHDAKLVIPNTSQAMLDDVLSRLQAEQQALAAAEQALASLTSVEDFAEAQSRDSEIIRAYAAYTQNAAEAAMLQREIDELTATSQPQRTKLDEVTKLANTLHQKITTDQAGVDTLRAAIANLRTYRQLIAQRQAWEAQLLSLEAAGSPAPIVADEPVPPEQPTTNPRMAALSSEIAAALVDLEKDRAYVTQFRTTGVAACPTCRTPVTNIASVVDEVEAGVIKKAALLDGMRQELLQLRDDATAANTAYLAKQRDYQAAVAARTKQLKQLGEWERSEAVRLGGIATLKSQLQAAQWPAAVDDDAAWAREVIEHDTAVNTLQGLRDLGASISAELSRVDGRLEAKRARLLVVQAATQNVVLESDSQAAASRIALRTAQQSEYGLKMAAVAALRPQVAYLTEEATRISASLQEATRIRNWIQEGAEVQEAIKQAQKIVLQTRLQQAERELNDLLRICDAEFVVEADASLNFTANFHDGRRQGARRLSGGQKTLLAWLFRIAAAVQFAENLDVLFLDEPTAYLDKKAIAAFTPVFDRLRGILVDRGLQVIIVTHEDELAPLFDHVISL